VAETIPNAELVRFPNVGHNPHLEAPELTFYSEGGDLLRTAPVPSPGRLLGLMSDREAVFGGLVLPEVRPREYFGVDLESGDITWRWTGPPVRSAAVRFQSGTLADGRPMYTTSAMPDCVPGDLAGAWQGQLFLSAISVCQQPPCTISTVGWGPGPRGSHRSTTCIGSSP